MKFRVYNIQWDTDGEDPKSLGLPSETTLEADSEHDLTYYGADQLSDKYSYCVFGFQYEKLRG